MIEIKSEEVGDGEQVEMVDLFAVTDDEGKRVVIQVPAKPRANVGLRVLSLTREHGEVIGQLMMLELLLGVDGYAALADCKGLTQVQLNQIVQEAMTLCLGALEETSGNSDSGSLKSVG